MYPDKFDVRQVAKQLGVTEKADLVWRDAGLAYEFLNFAKQCCHWQGKHYRQPVEQIKTLAESFIGHSIGEDAFLIGGSLANLKFNKKPEKLTEEYSSVSVSLPPLDRLTEFTMQWQVYQQSIEKAQIESETMSVGN